MPLLGQWTLKLDKNIASLTLDFQPTPLIYILVIVMCVINLSTIIITIVCFIRIHKRMRVMQEQYAVLYTTIGKTRQQRHRTYHRKPKLENSYTREAYQETSPAANNTSEPMN